MRSHSGNAASAPLVRTWANADEAVEWAVTVLGDLMVQTCDGCEPEAVPGVGVLPDHDKQSDLSWLRH